MSAIRRRVWAASAVVGYGYVGFLAVPLVWQEAGPITGLCVALSLAMTILIFGHEVLFGRSIFTGERKVEITDEMVDAAFDGYLTVLDIPYDEARRDPREAFRAALTAALGRRS